MLFEMRNSVFCDKWVGVEKSRLKGLVLRVREKKNVNRNQGNLKKEKSIFLLCDISLDARQITAIQTTTAKQASSNSR